MPNYPNIQLPSGCEETTEDPTIRSEFESGIVQTRARFTRQRRAWQLSWDIMKNTDYQILRDFYGQTRGGALSFVWVNPLSNEALTVRFKGELRAKCQSYNFWNVTLTLEQV